MHTIQLELDDTLYDDIVKKGINIQEVMKDTLKKTLYSKEYKIADDISKSMQDIKSENTKPVSELLSEL